MKLIYLALLVGTVCVGCARANISPHWYIEPADDFKWRACVDGGCGSPMDYNDALWWTETKGGTVKARVTRQ